MIFIHNVIKYKIFFLFHTIRVKIKGRNLIFNKTPEHKVIKIYDLDFISNKVWKL